MLNNLAYVNTRSEAIGLGNKLMQLGLFEHKESRHAFKDGYCVYQISSKYRESGLEAKARQVATQGCEVSSVHRCTTSFPRILEGLPCSPTVNRQTFAGVETSSAYVLESPRPQTYDRQLFAELPLIIKAIWQRACDDREQRKSIIRGMHKPLLKKRAAGELLRPCCLFSALSSCGCRKDVAVR